MMMLFCADGSGLVWLPSTSYTGQVLLTSSSPGLGCERRGGGRVPVCRIRAHTGRPLTPIEEGSARFTDVAIILASSPVTLVFSADGMVGKGTPFLVQAAAAAKLLLLTDVSAFNLAGRQLSTKPVVNLVDL